MAEVKILKHYRFSKKMLRELERESKRQRRPQTRILEIAFAHFMLPKANERDQFTTVIH